MSKVLNGLVTIARRFFRYDAASGDLFWIDPGPDRFANEGAYRMFCTRRVGKKAGSVSGTGYVTIRVAGSNYQAHRLIWAMQHGRDPVGDIDHIDGSKDNNRLGNLREATRSQNKMNTGANRNNKSGVKGVFWHKATGRWSACISKDGKNKHLGLFETVEAAAAAYAEACHDLHGAFANTGHAR